ncbi:MAG: hypothetical protein FE037_00355 [Thermoplasmata archaeon]|nr:MAG: hypothetical protein FE037_00355 [Thermoplasmata archaeon]
MTDGLNYTGKRKIEENPTPEEEKELQELEKENMKTIEDVYKAIKNDKEVNEWIKRIKFHTWVKTIEEG